MILDEKVLDRVGDYLFEADIRDNTDIKNLMKSVYYTDNQEYINKIPANAQNFVTKLQEMIPAFARYNINFAYSLAFKSQTQFLAAISSGMDEKKAEVEADKKVYQALRQYGIKTDDATGQTEQDELQFAISKNGEEKIECNLENGLLFGKHNANMVAANIKAVDVSLSNLQASMRNISAIADSLLNGIEKIKSDYSDSGFDYGRNLQQLDNREFILIDPRFKQQFALKYAKGELLLETSEDKKGLGDLIIAIDTSSSTQDRA
jgi:hypothetical protein